jgi:hypothetical protein
MNIVKRASRLKALNRGYFRGGNIKLRRMVVMRKSHLCRNNVNKPIHPTAMSSVLYLKNVFNLIIYEGTPYENPFHPD